MAIVPPGNKQVGSYALTAVGSEGDSVQLLSGKGYAVAKNPALDYSGQLPEFVQAGQYGLTGIGSEGDSLQLLSGRAYAVVHYLPPYTVTAVGAKAYAVVSDPNAKSNIEKPITVQAGGYALTGVATEGDSVQLLAARAYAIVQRYDLRTERLIHSLYFGSNNPYLGTTSDPYV